MPALFEHANITVSDPAATAAWMQRIFGWHLRWEGDAISGGHTKHVGTDTHYVALYTPNSAINGKPDSYHATGGLNHLAVVVENLDATEALVKAEGFTTGNHGDYEPGRRFYFHDADDIEFEVVNTTDPKTGDSSRGQGSRSEKSLICLSLRPWRIAPTLERVP